MKNIQITVIVLAMSLLTTMAFGQIKVSAPDGDVTIGNSAVAPTAIMNLNSRAGNPSATLRFNSENTNALFNYFDGGTDGLSSQWNVDMTTGKADGNATLGFFRSTNTTGLVSFLVFLGDNSPNSNVRLGANTNSYFNAFTGNVGIGTQSPLAGQKLHVEGSAYKTIGGDTWSIPSDRRLKNDIIEFSQGLEIINQIEPVEFTYNGRAGTIKGEHQIGVVAQELQKAAPFMVSTTNYKKVSVNEFGEETYSDEEEILVMNASSLKWILVNAVKEQQVIIEDQERRLADLEKLVSQFVNDDEISIETINTQNIVLSENSEKGMMQQNRPNPFEDFTNINYFVPETFNTAKIIIYTTDGKILKDVEITQAGEGSILVDATLISSGVYSYQLWIDGEKIETKKMVLAR